MVAKGGRAEGGVEWEAGVHICKCLCAEWINNKALLCSTATCIQHPVINCNRDNL